MRLPIHGYALRTARLNAGVTAPALAEQIGVTPNCVWRWEGFHEDIGIRPANWEALQAALGHHLEEAANGSPAKVGTMISHLREARADSPPIRSVWQVTITGVVISEDGSDPTLGNIEALMDDFCFQMTAEAGAVLLVPAGGEV